MKKNLVIVLLVLIIVGILAIFYINTIFLPVQLKHVVTQKISDYVGRNIIINEINYNPIRGIILRDLTIFREQEKQLPFIHIEEAKLNVPIPSILKQQKIIIPSITVKNPYVHIIRLSKNEWNFSDILLRRDSPERKKAPPFFLGSITIEGGQVDFTDEYANEVTTETIEEINLKAKLSLQKGVKYELEARMPEHTTHINIEGNYSLTDRTLSSRAAIKNLSLTKYFPLILNSDQVDFKNGFVDEADIEGTFSKNRIHLKGNFVVLTYFHLGLNKRMKGYISASDFTFRKEKDKTDISSQISIDDASLYLDDDKTYLADIQTQDFQMTVIGQDLNLNGNLDLRNTDIQHGINRKFTGHVSAKNVNFTKSQDNISLTGNLSAQNPVLQIAHDKKIKGNHLFVHSGSFLKNSSTTSVEGDFDIKKLDLHIGSKVAVKGDLNTKKTKFTFKNDKTSIASSFQIDQSDITIKPNNFISGSFKVNDGILNIKDKQYDMQGFVAAANSVFIIKDTEFQGDPKVQFNLHYNPYEEQPLKYTGTATFQSADIKGMPQFDEVTSIQGKIEFTNDLFKTESLDLFTLNSDLHISGLISDFTDPDIELAITSKKGDLEQLSYFFTPYLEKIRVWPSGLASFKLNYVGPLSKPKDAQIGATVFLQNAVLQGKSLPEKITDISGKIVYQTDQVMWEDLQGVYKNNSYLSSGSVTNFSRPILEGTLVSDHLQFETKTKILRKAFTITSLIGKYYDSPFDLKGEVHLNQYTGPYLDLKSQMDLDLAKLHIMFPTFYKKVRHLEPFGLLTAETLYRGTLRNWEKSTIVVTGTSPRLSFADYKLNDATVKFEQGDHEFSLLNIGANFYDGKLSISSKSDLKKKGFPFKTAIRLEEADLAKLKKDTKFKNKNISGDFSLQLDLVGFLKQIDQLQGDGSIIMKNGMLWEFSLLKGIWGALLIPSYQDIMIEEASTSFKIRNKRIMTNDLVLTSKAVDLLGEGWIDFKKNIRFDVTPNFKKSELINSKVFNKGPSAILSKAEGYIAIKITGKLDNPKYEINRFPSKVIEDATDALLDGVQGIFEEIF